MGTPQMGHQSKMAFDKTAAADAALGHVLTDFNADSFELEYLSESIVLNQSRIHSDGIRGTRSMGEERCRISQEAVGGSITMHPTHEELDLILPLILGADEDSDVFKVAETMQEFGIIIDRGTKRFSYAGCQIASATFSASSGQAMSLTLDILGKKETTSATAYPASIPIAKRDAPFIMSDTTISFPADSSASEISSFSVSIDNMLDGGRFMNSLTRTAIPSGGRQVSVSVSMPYTADEADMYKTALSANDGAFIQLQQTMTSGNPIYSSGTDLRTLKFTFGQVEFAAVSPTVSGKNGEYFLSLQGNAYSTTNGSTVTREIEILNKEE
tara:strand:+ start:12873 stop:13856 length:984 start_codon:yes stop_codon:yes gene_type:complete